MATNKQMTKAYILIQIVFKEELCSEEIKTEFEYIHNINELIIQTQRLIIYYHLTKLLSEENV